jgi:DNA-binding NarL/FixJ family response regulator
MPEIKIIIADDHPIFRQGLRQVIERDQSTQIVGEAEDGVAALQLIESLRPDVAVLDVDMPQLDGFQVARAVNDQGLLTKIIFLTMHKDEDVFNEAISLGVNGYVLKDSAVTDIPASIKAAAKGEDFISPQLASLLLKRRRRVDDLARQKPSLKSLTPTERRIVQLLAENHTSREVADELFVSVRTIENHRFNICTKLDLHGAHALLKFALEHKSELD